LSRSLFLAPASRRTHFILHAFSHLPLPRNILLSIFPSSFLLDTMASKHNLAELLQASGDAEGAAEMRRAILDEMGVEDMGEEEEGDAGRDIDVSKMDKF
jgi:hypothetical protein